MTDAAAIIAIRNRLQDTGSALDQLDRGRNSQGYALLAAIEGDVLEAVALLSDAACRKHPQLGVWRSRKKVHLMTEWTSWKSLPVDAGAGPPVV
jgi:hypothetical protein